MQQAHESRDGTAPPPSNSNAFNPLTVLLAVAAAAVLGVVGFFMLTGSETSPPPKFGPPEDAFALTDQEAITEFTRLHDLALRSASERNLSLLSHVFTANGPTGKRARRSIERLRADGVFDRSQVQTLKVDVISNEATTIQLLHKGTLRPCFVSKGGKDVTRGAGLVDQTTLWTLHLDGTKWLIHDAVIKRDKVVKTDHASC